MKTCPVCGKLVNLVVGRVNGQKVFRRFEIHWPGDDMLPGDDPCEGTGREA